MPSRSMPHRTSAARRPRPGRAPLAALALTLVIATVACSGDADDGSQEAAASPGTTASATPQATGAPADGAAGAPAGSEGDGDGDGGRAEGMVAWPLADSPWAMGHRDSLRQAATPLPGPTSDDVEVQVVDFLADAGLEGQRPMAEGRDVVQASPWMAFSSKRYADAPDARVQWAVSLTDVWKYAVDGTSTRYVDNEQLQDQIGSVGWNFVVMADDRVVVPSPLPSSRVENPACRATRSALLVFRDGDTIDSPIECVHSFEITDEVVRSCTGPDGQPLDPALLSYSVVRSAVLPTGELVTDIRTQSAEPGGPAGLYLIVVDHDLTRVESCAHVADSESTNEVAVEDLGEGRSALYVATADAFVKLVYDHEGTTLERRWVRPLDLRFRTGTTPTIVDAGDERFVAITNAPCAVNNPFTGGVTCDEDPAPARLVATRTDDERDEIFELELPEQFTNIECSPASHDGLLVIAQYGGYVPAPEARGVVAVRWDAEAQAFEQAWFNPDVQMNGVPTISTGSNLVYGSGVDTAGAVRLYGLRVVDGDGAVGGEAVLDLPIAEPDDWFGALDNGNNTIIGDDGSASWATFGGFVRVVPRSPSS